MARIDLNIIDRGIRGTEWTAENVGLTAAHLDEVMEQKTDNTSALNSLPTPFARFFVAREAFRRVKEEFNDEKKEAGFAYKQMVSDILDVYELLFNLKYHRNNTWKHGQKVELREWNSEENLNLLKTKMPVFYNSISEYYKNEIKENSLYFLVYTEDGKDKLLACSSPYTGFVTPPDLDKKNTDGVIIGKQYEELHIVRKSGGEYFRNIKLFEERDQEFKNYMYNYLFGPGEISLDYKSIKEYILSFRHDKDIKNDFVLKLTSVKTDQNGDLIINGLPILSSDEIDIASYFTPMLIQLPYRISNGNFQSIRYKKDIDGRSYDFLLPFKPEIFNLFKGINIDAEFSLNRQSVTVTLIYNGKEYKKDYGEESLKPGMGRILKLDSANIDFDLGIFPNILSYKQEENNYFKVLVTAAEKDSKINELNIDQVSLNFYKSAESGCSLIKELDPQTNGAQFTVLPSVVRSRQGVEGADCNTKYYELYKTTFDAIQVSIQGNSGLIIPIWKRSQPTNDTYTYAIDLGTSNTFISRSKNGESNMPELFKMDAPMVSYLHEAPKEEQILLSKRIEDSIFEKAKRAIRTEFVPPFVDGVNYDFPIRTAICGVKNRREKVKLFDNHNIAFFYEKFLSEEGQKIYTDIKWDKNTDLLRVFIRELLLIIKCDILQRNGDLNRTQIVWFRPLSFMGNIRSSYQDIWKEEPANVLFVQDAQVNCYTESEAPYYYFKKKNYIKDSDAVSVIDIGGGSTDFVYFKDNKPLISNSIHFGCDVLWSNGFNEFDDEKENGIYKHYADTLRFERQNLEDLNVYLKKISNSTTKDIINFWLSNADSCDITKRMREDFKPVFVYHLVSILYYMASMYKDNALPAPKTIVFSGNGSKYIDEFICPDKDVLNDLINLVFKQVFGGEHSVHLELPQERKESTCYGGLYRDVKAPDVPETVYHGDMSFNYEKVSDLNLHYDKLKSVLMNRYEKLAQLYNESLNLLKDKKIIDNTLNTTVYVNKAREDMETPFNTHYKTQVKEKYGDEVVLYNSVFFIPIIDRIFEMTNI